MVKQWIKAIASLFIFMFLIFEVGKVFFLLFYKDLISLCEVSTGEKLSALFQGFHVDLAAISYLLIIPFLLLSLYAIFQKKVFVGTLKYYFLFILVVCFLMIFGEIGFYGEWKSKISPKVFDYLKNPVEVYRSTSGKSFFLLLILTIISVVGFFFLYTKWLQPFFLKIKKSIIWGIAFFLIGTPLLFLFVRGGFQPIPLSQSNAFYSSCEVLNHVALNPVYNMIRSSYSILKLSNDKMFVFYPQIEAQKTFDNLYEKGQGDITQIVDTTIKKPNIVLIIAEGWSADLVEPFFGNAEVTPNFSKLEKEGVLFTRFYSSGTRSQQGIAAIVSSFPSIPNMAVTSSPEHYNKLASLVKVLKTQGYKSYFTYGGSLDYGNLKAYLTFCGYDKIIDENNFPLKATKGRLGFHDEDLFTCAFNDMKTAPSPFFYTFFTQSTHMPFDYPKRLPVIMKDSLESDYINSVHYADSQLGLFIEKAKKEKWYNNTLFIFVADHNHPSHKNHPYYTDNYRHIPMLWFGNMVAKEWQGKQIDKLGSHSDISKTLLGQLSLDNSSFVWGKNLLDKSTKEFAFVEINNGFGWITKNGYFYYDISANQYYANTLPQNETDSIAKDGKSFLQVLMNSYLH